MAVDLEDFYLVIPILGTAAALIFLWYISAILRHRRQASCMATTTPVRVPETLQSSQGQRSDPNRTNGGRGELVTKTCQRTGEEFTFFWMNDTIFSQWYFSNFVVDRLEYNCAEQYMMSQKARLFGDDVMAERILESRDPKDQKAMGRQVENFDPEKWNSNCKRIVKEGNLAKFGQNPELKEKLLATGRSTLVEASPFDRIWGIGLDSNNPKATDRRNWRGTNWLGEILTQVREELKTSANT